MSAQRLRRWSNIVHCLLGRIFCQINNSESESEYRRVRFFSIVKFTLINPLRPHDALKHHFTSLKTDFISLQQRVLERKFP